MQILKKYFISFIVFSIIGTLMHYVYDIIVRNPILDFIIPINESVWEHMKLIFYPALFFFVYNYDYPTKNNKSTYYASFIIGVTFAILFCIFCYYVYYIIFFEISEVLNIVLYYISMAIIFSIMYLMNYKLCNINSNFELLGEIIILSYIFIFIVFTYFPPSLCLFIPA